MQVINMASDTAAMFMSYFGLRLQNVKITQPNQEGRNLHVLHCMHCCSAKYSNNVGKINSLKPALQWSNKKNIIWEIRDTDLVHTTLSHVLFPLCKLTCCTI